MSKHFYILSVLSLTLLTDSAGFAWVHGSTMGPLGILATDTTTRLELTLVMLNLEAGLPWSAICTFVSCVPHVAA